MYAIRSYYEAGTVGVVTEVVAVGIQQQGVDGAGTFGARAVCCREFPGIFLERYGDIQPLV